MVGRTFKAGQLFGLIRARAKLTKDQTLFVYINGRRMVTADAALLKVYEESKDEDGFLYVMYSGENVLG